MSKVTTRAGIAVAAAGAAALLAIPIHGALVGAGSAPIPFDDARLKIEYNSTDGDAGMQFFVDVEEWQHVQITNPSGRKVADFSASQVIRDFGLSELFSESSEPSFDELPFDDFKQLFPEGDYTFTGETIDGQKLKSTFTLSHTVPDGPTITAPGEGATVAPDSLVVTWLPDDSPAPVDVTMYEVLVVDDAVGVPNPERSFDVMLPGDATSVNVPSQFLTPGSYKTEVLAIDRSGNQTLSEVAFTVA
jgi:hypothetical protein